MRALAGSATVALALLLALVALLTAPIVRRNDWRLGIRYLTSRFTVYGSRLQAAAAP